MNLLFPFDMAEDRPVNSIGDLSMDASLLNTYDAFLMGLYNDALTMPIGNPAFVKEPLKTQAVTLAEDFDLTNAAGTVRTDWCPADAMSPITSIAPFTPTL